MNEMEPEHQKRKSPAVANWVKRFGVAGFLFFFIKGLIWLAVFVAATYFGYDFFN